MVTLKCNNGNGIIGTSITVKTNENFTDKSLSFQMIQVFGYHNASLKDNQEPGRPGKLIAIDIDNEGLAYVINISGYIFKKDLKKWKQLAGLGRDISVRFASELWIIGKDFSDDVDKYQGHIYKSKDYGVSWIQYQGDERSTISAYL